MRPTLLLLAAALIVSASGLAGLAAAEAGAGACVAGIGVSLHETSLASPYVGVNVGWRNSTTGAHTDRASFQTACCAEADRAPDCFRPAA